ncbi:hypothetical protein DOY81_001192, partial [Sarcophaga bullata]
ILQGQLQVAPFAKSPENKNFNAKIIQQKQKVIITLAVAWCLKISGKKIKKEMKIQYGGVIVLTFIRSGVYLF